MGQKSKARKFRKKVKKEGRHLEEHIGWDIYNTSFYDDKHALYAIRQRDDYGYAVTVPLDCPVEEAVTYLKTKISSKEMTEECSS